MNVEDRGLVVVYLKRSEDKMKASDTLTQPFLVGVLTDICSLFPEYDFSYEISELEALFVHFEEKDVIQDAARIGKALERSLITGQSFSCPSVIFSSPCGTAYPRFLEYVWEIVFAPSGVPVFKVDDYTDTLIDVLVDNQYDDSDLLPQLTWGHSNEEERVRNQQALAVLVLRQFFLGLSKLTSLECLYLGAIRVGCFQGADYYSISTEFFSE